MEVGARLGALTLALAALAAAPARPAEKDFVVVVHGQGAGSTAIDDRITASDGYVRQRWEDLGVVIASSSNPSFAAEVAADPRVHGVSEDVEVQWLPREIASPVPVEEGDAGPTSPVAVPWNIRQIGADVAAAEGFEGKGARVAVLDDGVWVHHPGLEQNVDLALARSFVPDEPGAEPIVAGFSHGTHVAGVIAAPINGRGIQGVAPQAEIVPIKVLRSTTGSGLFSWIIDGILYATSIHADVINMSLGMTFDRRQEGGGSSACGGKCGPLVAALNRAVNQATASGSLVVCAAGNDGVDLNGRLWVVPAQSGGAMAVAATGPFRQADFDRPASYTNYGQSVISVAAPGGDYVKGGSIRDEVYAPGGRVSLAGSYLNYYAFGTSMAAAHVSGLAALIVGAYGGTRPAQVRSLIERSADDILKPGADPYSGRGRINAARALGLE